MLCYVPDCTHSSLSQHTKLKECVEVHCSLISLVTASPTCHVSHNSLVPMLGLVIPFLEYRLFLQMVSSCVEVLEVFESLVL